MAVTKAQKATILKNVTDVFKNTASAVFVGFKGLTVAEVNELRAALKQQGVKYSVAKKTLLKKAIEANNVAGDMPELSGEVAYAYLKDGEDITAPARHVHAFGKKFSGKLSLLGGVMEGKFLSGAETLTIATIPPTDVLRGMFVNVINSPIQRFAIAIHEVAKKQA